jgi:MSHA pilin protein MshC
MQKSERGFTLIELITVMILISLVSATLFSRIGSVSTANLQAGRDDLIAALFFAQQSAMARSNIQVILTTTSVSVTENGTPLIVHSKGYPLTFPSGVSVTPATLTYDKLGRTTATTLTLSASGGTSATVTVEESGYAH